jgi:hypothetical protein
MNWAPNACSIESANAWLDQPWPMASCRAHGPIRRVSLSAAIDLQILYDIGDQVENRH